MRQLGKLSLSVPPGQEKAEPTEPESYPEIVLLGEMIRDAATISEKLKGLPFSEEAFRGNLRVVISACKRIKDSCAELLGEAVEKRPGVQAESQARPK